MGENNETKCCLLMGIEILQVHGNLKTQNKEKSVSFPLMNKNKNHYTCLLCHYYQIKHLFANIICNWNPLQMLHLNVKCL